jgi:hypothetical protein
MNDPKDQDQVAKTGRFLGSLREALVAASRDEPAKAPAPAAAEGAAPRAVPSAAEAAREARGGAPHIPPMDRHVEIEQPPPTTRVVRSPGAAPSAASPKTQLIRGKQQVARGGFDQDPVVGWLVIVGGPGLGSYRPIFEGNNSIGRASGQRIPIDFGDDAISSEEQAFIRYDGADRSFLFVPNLSKTNVVSLNDKRPTGAVALTAMDVITMGRTQLVFIPFCGPEFDWSDISEAKG